MLPLSVYEVTWTHSPPPVEMHLLDRSCVIVGIFLKYYVPQQWYQSQVYALMLYAQVEHNELWAIIVILLTTNVLL